MAASNVTFGRYQVLSTLGRGGFATVYRALDTALKREVALKVLSSHLAEVPSIRQRFLTEAQVLARLDHPNIIQVFDVGETAGQPFFAMRLIEGETLDGLLHHTGPLPLSRVVEIMQNVCSAVDYLHSSALIHRDIKAANIMVDRAGRIVLMDFGIARVLDGTQYTNTGAILGTPEAMAPEQALGESVSPASDIYALGILAYKLLAGRVPFVGATPYVLKAHAYDEPPALMTSRPGLPPPVYQVISASLAKSPMNRPASAASFARQLTNAASGQLDVGRTLTMQSDSWKSAFAQAPDSRDQTQQDARQHRLQPTMISVSDRPASRPTGHITQRLAMIGAFGALGILAVIGFSLYIAGRSQSQSQAGITAPTIPAQAAPPTVAVDVPAPTRTVTPAPTNVARPFPAPIIASTVPTTPATSVVLHSTCPAAPAPSDRSSFLEATVTIPGASPVVVRFGFGKAPLQDPRVRQGLALSIDPVAIAAVVTANGVTSQGAPSLTVNGRTMRSADVQSAKQLLAAAGFPVGFSSVHLLAANGTLSSQIAASLKQQWQQSVGMNTEVDIVDPATLASQCASDNIDAAIDLPN